MNPRSSRTIPYISKVTGVPIIDLATKVMLGQKLKDLGYGTGIYKEADYFAVKMPVFSFEKLADVDTGLGPEMKSTGEVLGIAESFPQALLKAFKASPGVSRTWAWRFWAPRAPARCWKRRACPVLKWLACLSGTPTSWI